MGGLLARPACEAAVAGLSLWSLLDSQEFSRFWRFGTSSTQFETCKQVTQKVLLFGECYQCAQPMNKHSSMNKFRRKKPWSNPKALTPRFKSLWGPSLSLISPAHMPGPFSTIRGCCLWRNLQQVLLRQDSVAVEMFVHPVLALPQSNRRSTMKAYITVIPIGWG